MVEINMYLYPRLVTTPTNKVTYTPITNLHTLESTFSDLNVSFQRDINYLMPAKVVCLTMNPLRLILLEDFSFITRMVLTRVGTYIPA